MWKRAATDQAALPEDGVNLNSGLQRGPKPIIFR